MLKPTGCERERSVVQESAAGDLSEAARTHIASCADCREALKVARWMQFFAVSAPTQPPRLPSAGTLLWKFQLLEKRRAARRVTQPILVAQVAAGIVATTTFLWLTLSGRLPFARQVSAHFGDALAALEAAAAPLLVGFACAAFVCLALLYTLRRLSVDN